MAKSTQMTNLNVNENLNTNQQSRLQELLTCVDNCAQLLYTIWNSSDNLPFYPQTIIIAQILSTEGEGERR